MTARKLILVAVRVRISICLVYFMVSRVGSREIPENMRLLDLRAFFLAVLVYAASIFIATLRWRLFIAGKIGIRSLF
jgi:hypothetical protein